MNNYTYSEFVLWMWSRDSCQSTFYFFYVHRSVSSLCWSGHPLWNLVLCISCLPCISIALLAFFIYLILPAVHSKVPNLRSWFNFLLQCVKSNNFKHLNQLSFRLQWKTVYLKRPHCLLPRSKLFLSFWPFIFVHAPKSHHWRIKLKA